jgi:hypothetical protein
MIFSLSIRMSQTLLSILGLADWNSTSFFLVFLILASLLSIFFLLYFNRVFASIVSYSVRTWLWHQYRIYFDVQALQISLLGGRVFFTGLRYHGNNETFLIQNGHITWCYWLRRVRQCGLATEEDRETATGEAGIAKGNNNGRSGTLPCRINVSLIGLEWFVYNRSAAYESILAGLTETTPLEKPSNDTLPDEEPRGKLRKRRSGQLEKSTDSAVGRHRIEKDSSREKNVGREQPNRSKTIESYSATERGDDRGRDSCETSDLPAMLQLFPISVECEKAAVVMGNENTKALLIVKADRLSGEIDASETQTPDPYRQVFKIRFEHPVVEMKENEDYKEEQTSRATRETQVAREAGPVNRRSFLKRQKRRFIAHLRNLVPYWRKSVESFSLDSHTALDAATSQIPGLSQWQGLSRYIDERDHDDKTRWSSVEYAAVSTVLDSPEASLTIFWDVVGKVLASKPLNGAKKEDSVININGGKPPAWGINLSIKGGIVNYGPWADRQRSELQRIFFPSLCKDAVPSKPLPPGADRMPTEFKLYVELDDEVTVRIPIREESKNWRWKGKEQPIRTAPTRRRQKGRSKKSSAGDASQLRSAGWLDVRLTQMPRFHTPWICLPAHLGIPTR